MMELSSHFLKLKKIRKIFKKLSSSHKQFKKNRMTIGEVFADKEKDYAKI